ncbi:lipid kinase [Microbulbifer sp. THAF38]|uniref:lipid kinase n=1 Tax=Microbulbifer sp. THAF38 TaxID=2587856 RepID=UPI001267C100|nr:lipid kinase [Microbulbifer sp. THAF38]
MSSTQKKSRRALLVVNPKSRNGAEADIDSGIERLRADGVEVEVLHSEGPQKTEDAIRQRHKALDFVIVGGGDGTISSTARVLKECQLPLAILPLGTANDLARSLGIEELDQAFDVIIENHRQPIDLGVVNGHYFFNVANMGLGVKVTEAQDSEIKKRWGVLSYLRAFFVALRRAQKFRVKLALDDERYRMGSIQLAVGNGRYYGGGNLVAEEARINDARLDLYCLRPRGLMELLGMALLVRGGKHHLAKRIFNASAQHIEVETKPRLEIHADGEPVTNTPATFSVIPKALEVLVPRNSEELLSEKERGQ